MAERNLTDADIEALATALETRLARHFYLNIGKGVWGFVWKGLLVALLAVAAYGSIR